MLPRLKSKLPKKLRLYLTDIFKQLLTLSHDAKKQARRPDSRGWHTI